MSNFNTKSLSFSQPYGAGKPATQYLSLETSIIESSTVPSSSIVVKFLAAPVNPVDLLVLAGKYPVKPRFKTTSDSFLAGFDGVAEVVFIGSDVEDIHIGDQVLPRVHGLGTWRTHAMLESADVIPLPKGVDCQFAALIKMGFGPAYFLLQDMRNLQPGEWVIMNAGSSVIAQAMAQLARLRGVRTILVVRDRERARIESLREQCGADVIVTESQLAESTAPVRDNIVFAIDCVFGKSGANLVRNLAPGGTYVVMGFLSRNDPTNEDPVGDFKIDETNIFYNAIEFKNFRLSKCLEKRSATNMADMMKWFCELQRDGLLRTPELETHAWLHSTSERELLDIVSKATDTTVGGKKHVFLFE